MNTTVNSMNKNQFIHLHFLAVIKFSSSLLNLYSSNEDFDGYNFL